MGFTYSQSLYRGKSVIELRKEYVKKALEAHEATGSTTLVSKSSSGCAIATAIMTHPKTSFFSHLHCNKGEGSHSGRFSGLVTDNANGLIFVDDFIDSGATLLSITEHLKKHAFYNTIKIVAAVYSAELSSFKLCDIKPNVLRFSVNID